MTDEVSARTEDLEHFFDSGGTYFTMLDDALADCRSYRTSTMAVLGHSTGIDSIQPFQELVAEVSINNGFVEGVHDALVLYDEGQDVVVAPAAEVEANLAIVGLATSDVTIGANGEDNSLSEDLRRAADAARARGDFDVADSFMAQADELERYQLLVDGGVETRHADVIAAGPPELAEAVLAGDVNPFVATLIPTLTPNLAGAIINGDLTYAEARHIDDAPQHILDAVLAGEITPFEARRLHGSGLSDDDEVVIAVLSGQLTTAEATAMADFPEGLRHAVIRGDVPIELAEEIMAGPDVAIDAAEDGDFGRAALLTLDPEVQSAHTVGTYFPQIFDDDKIDDLDDRIVALGQPGAMDGVRERLRDDVGLTGPALDAAVADIEFAVDFYGDPTNSAQLVALDDANDGDPDNDNKAEANDAILRVVQLTPSSGSAAERHVRDMAITNWIAGQDGMGSGGLEDAFYGESRLGDVDATDQQVIVDAFVSTRVDLIHDQNTDYPPPTQLPAFASLQETAGWAARRRDDHPELVEMLTDAYADGAIDLQLGRPDDELSNLIAATLSVGALEMVPLEDRDEFLAGLDGVYEIPYPDGSGYTTLTEGGLFAAALALDEPFAVEHDSMSGFVYNFDTRKMVAADTMAAIADDAGPGGSFSDGESAFVDVLFATASPLAYQSYSWDAGLEGVDLDTDFTAAMSRVIAINAYPDDAEAQEFHGDRLFGILSVWESNAALTNTQFFDQASIDVDTRSRLVTTAIFGRPVTEEIDAELEFWTVEDFHDDTVVTDFAVDVARDVSFATTGNRLSPGDEGRIRRIMATGQGRDLLGFNHDVDPSLRAQVLHLVIENNWDEDTFTETDNPWENETINGAFLTRSAEVNLNNGEPLSDEQMARLDELVTDDNASRILGLQSPLDLDAKMLVLDRVINGHWTVEQFNEDFANGDIDLNPNVNALFAQNAIDLYSPDGEVGQQLAGLQGDTEGYVFTALGIEPDSPASGQVSPIIERIQGYEGDHGPLTLEAIPVSLHFGNQERGVVVLFRVEDADGNLVQIVDQRGYEYDSTHEWWTHSELPRAAVTVPTTSGGGHVRDLEFGYSDDTQTITFRSEGYDPSTWERWGEPILKGLGVVGGVVLIVGSGGTLTPVVVGAGATLVVTASGYEIIQSTRDLNMHTERGGSLSLSDPYARGAWVNITSNAFSIGTAGTTALVSRGTRGLSVVGANGVPQATTGVRNFQRFAGWVGDGADVYDVWSVISDPNLTDSQKLWALGQMGLWSAPGFLAGKYVDSRPDEGFDPTSPVDPDGLPLDSDHADLSTSSTTDVLLVDPASQGLTTAEFTGLADQSFADFKADYHDKWPNGRFSDVELRHRFDLGQRVNPNGRAPRFIDTRAIPTASPIVIGGSHQEVDLDTLDHGGFDYMAAVRADPTLTAYQKVRASEDLGEVGGEIAIDNYVAERFGPDATYEFVGGQFGATGTFDQVVVIQSGGQQFVLINEAKGGAGRLSTRRVEGTDYQQGTPEHTLSTLEALRRTNPEAADLILEAYASGDLIYITSRVHLNPAGEATRLTIDEFDVTPTASSFQPEGVNATGVDEFLATPDGQALIALAAEVDPDGSPDAINDRVEDWVRTGVAPPDVITVTEPLVKIVPTGSTVTPYTPFFTTLSELQRARELGVPLADYFGLPAGSSAQNYDLYVIHPVDGAGGAVGYESTIAPTAELDGLITRNGGGTQVIVPDRSQYTEPELVATIYESAPLPPIDLPVPPATGVTGVDPANADPTGSFLAVDPADASTVAAAEGRILDLAEAGAPVLEIHVPPGQAATLASLIDFGLEQGVTVRIVEAP